MFGHQLTTALLAIDDTCGFRDDAADTSNFVYSLEDGLAGRGDVIDDEHLFTAQTLLRPQAFDKVARAMLLCALADKGRFDRPAFC